MWGALPTAGRGAFAACPAPVRARSAELPSISGAWGRAIDAPGAAQVIDMGAGVSTEGAPLTRVKCKNNLGVLFDPAAEEKFYAAATGPEDELAVPWSVADAYVKTRLSLIHI